ncbi:N-acetyltransferase [Altericroceibacterium spongiae]|uniref:N-acetyltransferase n=1 Tax=Altericroceibacterium spongiae TaxID=2320269 RepID=A0A420EJZ5_9SPHN|nr:GNAT family N-acetyltransferase [Altericroceibacterium spongiae]RKF20997.1 N-acetyltransferase [Altericroceibacterium spongiae]
MFVRTDRLFLRPVFEEDWQALYKGLHDRDLVRMLANAPWPYEPAHAREFVRRAQNPFLPGFAITIPGEKGAPLIGQIGLNCHEDGPEIGYWIRRDRWGQGYATEAGKGFLEVVRMLGHKQIHGGHYLDNPASGRVLTRLGFRRTGEVRRLVSKGRGGEAVLTCRYVCKLAGGSAKADISDVPDPEMQAA